MTELQTERLDAEDSALSEIESAVRNVRYRYYPYIEPYTIDSILEQVCDRRNEIDCQFELPIADSTWQ